MEDFLIHYGLKGQKWGVRRFQNEDGSLTPAGRARYYDDERNKGLVAAKNERKLDDIRQKMERLYAKDYPNLVEPPRFYYGDKNSGYALKMETTFQYPGENFERSQVQMWDHRGNYMGYYNTKKTSGETGVLEETPKKTVGSILRDFGNTVVDTTIKGIEKGLSIVSSIIGKVKDTPVAKENTPKGSSNSVSAVKNPTIRPPRNETLIDRIKERSSR